MILIGYRDMSEDEFKQYIVEVYYAAQQHVDKYDILIASGGDDGGYEEWSFFLLREKETGKLFENNASHCSCFGFEGQFAPVETSLTYLKSDNFYATGIGKTELQKCLKQLNL